MEYKVCDINYFLDIMQPYELNALLDVIEYSAKLSWEQTRFQSYITAKSFSSNNIKLTDLIKFGWDDVTDEKVTHISNEDIIRLTNKAQNIIDNGRLSNQT